MKDVQSTRSSAGRGWALILSLTVSGAVSCGEGQIGSSEDDGLSSSIDEVRGGRWRCGDGVCHHRESCSSCPIDCACPSAIDAGTSGPPDSGSATPDAGSAAPDAGSATPDAAGASADSGTRPALDCRNAISWPAAWVAFEDDVLTLVNQRRAAGATCGTTAFSPVAPLSSNAALREAARCHSLDMATQNYFSHTGLDGSSPWTRIAAANYTGFATGENIAAGYSTPASVMDGWMSSPGHCGNIMSAGSNEIGVGYAYSASSTYGHYWTQTFGVH